MQRHSLLLQNHIFRKRKPLLSDWFPLETFKNSRYAVSQTKTAKFTNDTKELTDDGDDRVDELVCSLGLPLRADGFLTVCNGLQVAGKVLVDEADRSAVQKVLSRVERAFQNEKLPNMSETWQKYQAQELHQA
jgi:hypothetical protein